MLGSESVGTLASSCTWLSNSGVKALVSAVCSRPFTVHPHIWHYLVLHISLQRHSSMPYLLALLQEMGTISKSTPSLWILCLGSYLLQGRGLLSPSVASKQKL